MNLQCQYDCLAEINFNPEEIIIPDDFIWVRSLDEFKIKYSNKWWKLNHRYFRIYDFFSRIEEKYCKSKDPIKFLYYLYYDVKISTVDIENEFWKLWEYTEWTIWKSIMRNVLWWKLRWENWLNFKTTLRTEKDQKKIKWLNEEKTKEKQENIQNVENILNRISKNKEKVWFSKDIFSELKNIRSKTQYILNINWYIQENNFVETLIKLSDKYGIKVTAQAITNILEKETSKIWNIDKIELRAWRIREIKNEQN